MTGLGQICQSLRHSHYTERDIVSLLEVPEIPPFGRRVQTLLLYLWRTRGGGRLDTLVRLFLLHQAVSLEEVVFCIKPTCVEDWVQAGLLHVNNYNVTASVELCPYGSLLLAADWPNEAQPDFNEVMGIAASSRTLAQATIRRHAQATLDLGTGSGILALLAAAHSEHIAAVDSNPRALATAQLNARLNAVANVEFLQGDLFEPVKGRQFDLIVCNPPFVIAPEQIYLHSHSDMPLDRFCENVVRTAPVFMAEGSYCQLLCNWVQLAGEDWRARLASWFEGSGCDVWVLHSHSEDAAEYAFNRISNLASNQGRIEDQFKAWTDYYEKERIEAIGFGLVTMRRSNRMSHWFRCESWPAMVGPCGDAIERGFVAREFLQNHDDHELLETRLRHAPNVKWRQDRDLSDLGSLSHSSLYFTSGLAYTAKVDPAVVELISRCGGDRPLSDYLKQTAAASGDDLIQFAPRFLTVVRRLVEWGFLLPV